MELGWKDEFLSIFFCRHISFHKCIPTVLLGISLTLSIM